MKLHSTTILDAVRLYVVLFVFDHMSRHGNGIAAQRSFKKQALDLVDALLTMNPEKRMTAGQALDHEYFWTDPMPCEPSELPSFKIESAHEFEAKKRRKAKDEVHRAKRHQQHPPGRGGQAVHSNARPAYGRRN